MDKQVKILTRDKGREWPEMVRVMLSSIWAASDKPVKVTVEEDNLTRNAAQNRLLWKWHGEFCEFLYQSRGELVSTQTWHDKMVPEYLPSEPVKIQGKWFTPRAETKKLKVKEFAAFLMIYEIEAAQEGCVFTHPDDLYLKAVMQDAE